MKEVVDAVVGATNRKTERLIVVGPWVDVGAAEVEVASAGA